MQSPTIRTDMASRSREKAIGGECRQKHGWSTTASSFCSEIFLGLTEMCCSTPVLLVSGMVTPLATGVNVVPCCSRPAAPSCIHTGVLHQLEVRCVTLTSSQLCAAQLPCFEEDGAAQGLGSACFGRLPGAHREPQGGAVPFHPPVSLGLRFIWTYTYHHRMQLCLQA